MGVESSTCQAGQSQCLARPLSSTSSMSPLVRQMHIAVMQNDINRLLFILRLGVDVNSPWLNPLQPSVKDGSMALNEAVSLNHVDVVKALIAAGAETSLVDRDGMTPLHRCAYHGRASIVPLLVSAGADVFDVDKEGNTPLHTCVKSGSIHNNLQCVINLIDNGALVSMKNKRGQVALHFAAMWGLSEFVLILLEARSNIDAQDNEYLTPLYYCLLPAVENQFGKPASAVRSCLRRNLLTVLLLLEAGSDPLGLSTWFTKHWALKGEIDHEPFMKYHTSNYPESLKHLCRVYIQNRLGFTNVRHKFCVRKVRKLDIPETLTSYLCRRLLPV